MANVVWLEANTFPWQPNRQRFEVLSVELINREPTLTVRSCGSIDHQEPLKVSSKRIVGFDLGDLSIFTRGAGWHYSAALAAEPEAAPPGPQHPPAPPRVPPTPKRRPVAPESALQRLYDAFLKSACALTQALEASELPHTLDPGDTKRSTRMVFTRPDGSAESSLMVERDVASSRLTVTWDGGDR